MFLTDLCVAVTISISLACLKRLEAISAGTVLAAIFLGYVVKAFSKRLLPFYSRWVEGERSECP